MVCSPVDAFLKVEIRRAHVRRCQFVRATTAALDFQIIGMEEERERQRERGRESTSLMGAYVEEREFELLTINLSDEDLSFSLEVRCSLACMEDRREND